MWSTCIVVVVTRVMVRRVKLPMWPVGEGAHPVFVGRRTWGRRTREGLRHGMGWRVILGIPQSPAVTLSAPTG